MVKCAREGCNVIKKRTNHQIRMGRGKYCGKDCMLIEQRKIGMFRNYKNRY